MNVGIVIPNLGVSQLSFLAINQANIGNIKGKHNYFLFQHDIAMPCIPTRCAVLNISELTNFNGDIITTNIEDTLTAIRTINKGRYIFYVWDLEWLRNNGIDFQRAMTAYRNNKVCLVARSNDHAKAIENYCNRNVNLVVSSLNTEAILERIGERNEFCRTT